jgi:hypothetical protein
MRSIYSYKSIILSVLQSGFYLMIMNYNERKRTGLYVRGLLLMEANYERDSLSISVTLYLVLRFSGQYTIL